MDNMDLSFKLLKGRPISKGLQSDVCGEYTFLFHHFDPLCSVTDNSIIKYTFKMLLLYLKVLRDNIHYLLLYTLLTLLQLFKLFAAVNR